MTSNALVSVIVPCFNVEATVKETLHSLCNQTYTNWECHCVVDAKTTDRTVEILHSCDDPRIHIHLPHDEKGGVSRARNIGLDHAQGEWITFLDADDLYTPRHLETLLSAVEDNVDIVVGAHTLIRDTRRIVRDYCPGISHLSGREATEKLLRGDIGGFIWQILFRHSVVSAIKFPEGIHRGEDYAFCVDAFLSARTLAFTHQTTYEYRIRPHSLSFGQVLSLDSCESLVERIDHSLDVAGVSKDMTQEREISLSSIFLNAVNLAALNMSLPQAVRYAREATARFIHHRRSRLKIPGYLGWAMALLHTFPTVYVLFYRLYTRILYRIH